MKEEAAKKSPVKSKIDSSKTAAPKKPRAKRTVKIEVVAPRFTRTEMIINYLGLSVLIIGSLALVVASLL